MLGIHFGNSSLDNSNWDKISLAKKFIFTKHCDCHWEKNKWLWTKSSSYPNFGIYIGQIFAIAKLTKKDIAKRMYNFLWNNKKIRSHRNLAPLSIWKGGLGILDIHTQLNSLKSIWIQRSLNPTNALWKYLMLYQLNLNTYFQPKLSSI